MRKAGLWLLIALMAAVLPAGADDTVFKGLDFWYTPAGGGNLNISIPAGFFCSGNSGPLNLTIPLKGRPLVTNPGGAINPADTVVDREADISFNGGLTANGNLRIRALDLVSVQAFTVSCPGGLTEFYTTEVSLSGAQGLGTIQIRKNAINDRFGKFDASFPVNAKVRFKNGATGVFTGFLTHNATITTLDACWSHDPGAGSIRCAFPAPPITLDVDGDRVITGADWTSPYCTSNFFPGWTYVNGVVVQCPISHPGGPHPTTCGAPGTACPEQPPSNNCTTDILTYLDSHRTSDGFVLGDTSALNAKFSRRSTGKAGSFTTTVSGERIAVSREDLGAVRVDRCIQQQGVSLFNDTAVTVTGSGTVH